MQSLDLLPRYLYWHYGQGIKETGRFDLRLLKAVQRSFSFSLLFHTFLTPWRRSGEGYIKSEPGTWLSTFVFNSVMRALGVVIRTGILVVGSLSYVITLVVSLFVFIFWLIAPIAVVALFVIGLKELLS